MDCPECKYQNVRITHSYPEGDHTIRRRECMRCGLRFVTQEKIKNLTKGSGKSHIYAG